MDRDSTGSPSVAPLTDGRGHRLGMWPASAPLLVAFSCAGLLLFAPVGERTYWDHLDFRDGFMRVYDNGLYEFLGLLYGAIALTGLSRAVWGEPRWRPVALGFGAAVVSFALAFAAYGFYWLEASRGIFRSEGRVYAPEGWTVHPMTGYRLFTIAAAAGTVATVTLAVMWLTQFRRR